MKIPNLVLLFLSKELQRKYIKHVWDKKTDEDILFAYNDSIGWVDLAGGRMKSETLDGVALSCKKRLCDYILPQIKKRGLNISFKEENK